MHRSSIYCYFALSRWPASRERREHMSSLSFRCPHLLSHPISPRRYPSLLSHLLWSAPLTQLSHFNCILLCLLPFPSLFLCISFVHTVRFAASLRFPSQGLHLPCSYIQGADSAGAMQGRKVAAAAAAAAARSQACCSTAPQINDAARFEAAAISWYKCTLWSLQQRANVSGRMMLGWVRWTLSTAFQKKDGQKRDPKNGTLIFIRAD